MRPVSSPKRSTRNSLASALPTTARLRSTGSSILDDATIATFQQELGKMGYAFQFITLAGFHALNAGMFELAQGYAKEGMTAYVKLQEAEFGMEGAGYTATRHQREVGAGYFDRISETVSGGNSSTSGSQGIDRRRAVLRRQRGRDGLATFKRVDPSGPPSSICIVPTASLA